MSVGTIDTLKYAKLLKAAGVPEEQAEAHVSFMADALAVNLKDFATKDDLTNALGATEQRLDAKIDVLRAEMDGRFTLLKWMVGVSITLSLATLALLGRLLFKMP